MTLRPDELGAADAASLSEAGVSRESADDAVMVSVLFNMIDRVADGLGFEVLSEEAFQKAGRVLLERGYA